MSNYGTDDLTIDEAIKLVGELEDALTWMEWWFCGKDDKMADHINEDTRQDISKILHRANEIRSNYPEDPKYRMAFGIDIEESLDKLTVRRTE